MGYNAAAITDLGPHALVVSEAVAGVFIADSSPGNGETCGGSSGVAGAASATNPQVMFNKGRADAMLTRDVTCLGARMRRVPSPGK
jgi:hypothetical protein